MCVIDCNGKPSVFLNHVVDLKGIDGKEDILKLSKCEVSDWINSAHIMDSIDLVRNKTENYKMAIINHLESLHGSAPYTP